MVLKNSKLFGEMIWDKNKMNQKLKFKKNRGRNNTTSRTSGLVIEGQRRAR